MNGFPVMTAAFGAAFFISAPAAAAPERPAPLVYDLEVPASADAVWQAWSTVEGLESWFARKAEIEGKVDGHFSILFFPHLPVGQQGAEGMRILAFEPGERIAFSWNSPPAYAYTRAQRAFVDVVFDDAGNGQTHVQLRHFGWGRGEKWQEARDYFADGWKPVLTRLIYRFSHGPIDWDNPPEIESDRVILASID